MDWRTLKAAATKVKNKAPAEIQITAEQILRESKDRAEKPYVPAKPEITDKEELKDYQLGKRITFENAIRRNRTAVGAWLKYAAWEESQFELERARSVYERSIDVDPRVTIIWQKYAEMEMRNKNVNRARNVLDRAVAILPRVDLFWYKYTYMEELLDNVAGARQVFERWMEWRPTEEAWMAFVKFEMRYKEVDRARQIFGRFVTTFPDTKNWLKFAKFEEQQAEPDRAREIYQTCMDNYPGFIDQNFYVSFARFEVRAKEIERARIIFKFGLGKLPLGQKENLMNEYTIFEKQYGGKEGIEIVVASKRRLKYEEDLSNNAYNYDVWFDYIRLEQEFGEPEKVRELFERAIAQVPPVEEKKRWSRYIYLWLFYTSWEELEGNVERAHSVFKAMISLIPHKKFTFAKCWLLYAKFLIRKKELTSARKLLGQSIGMCPKGKLFTGYIELELGLREFDRARILYEKYLEWNPTNCYGWIKYTELENMLGETERVRQIYEIAVSLPNMDTPEVLWKAYIDFEMSESEYSNARNLYKRLLEKTDHVKVHVAYANFESLAQDSENGLTKAREYFEKMNKTYRSTNLKEERNFLLESWLEFESNNGTEEDVAKVEALLPKTIKKRRKLQGDQWEEYYDYIFPGDEVEKPNLKLLQMAHQWKQQQS